MSRPTIRFTALALLSLAACSEAPPPPPAHPICPMYVALFDFDSSAINQKTEQLVRLVARHLSEQPWRLRIIGHTDRAGSADYNVVLSQRRAKAVRDALVREGIPAERLAIMYRGELEPLVKTQDGVREPENRRVELVGY